MMNYILNNLNISLIMRVWISDMMKRVLNSFNELVQLNCFSYLRHDRVLLHKESNLKYSKYWINKNEGLTEDEIRGKFSSMVDEYDITLLDELFIQI